MHYDHRALSLSSYYVTTKPQLSIMGKLFIAILLITVFEGAFRKWISSALTNPFVLLRDAMALFGIFWAIKIGRIKFRQVGGQMLWLWTAIFLMWGLLQLIINQTSLFIFIIGARFWLLYLWFAYAAAITLTKHDFDFIAKTIILILLVMTPLAVLQHFFPPSAFVNKQVDGDETKVFLVAADIVRTTGTFSFTLGYTVFLSIATPFVLVLLTPGTKLWNWNWMPKICVLALGIATIVSGSRGAIIFSGIIFAAYILTSLLYSRGSKKSSTMLMLAGAIALLALVPLVFTRAIDATQSRFESAAGEEGFDDRIFSMFLGEPGIYINFPLIGHGVGAGSNFAGVIAGTTFSLGETEAARTVLEGGLLGIVFIGLKLLVILIGLRKSWFIVRRSGSTLPLMLWITTSIALLSWSIIGQLTVNALGYLLFGLAVASLRLFTRR